MSRWAEAEARARVVAAGSRLGRSGLLRACEGNLSCRLDGHRFLITPQGVSKHAMSGWELVVCRLDVPVGRPASSEGEAHRACYRGNSEIQALAHAHPSFVLAAQAAGIELVSDHFFEARLLLPSIATVGPHPAGSLELAEACAAALRTAPVAILRGHGALAAGATVEEAAARLELLEHLASIAVFTALGHSHGF